MLSRLQGKGLKSAFAAAIATAICVGTAPAGAATGGGVAPSCIEAGLAPPTMMKANFELSDAGPEHRDVTIPRIHYRYRIPALPVACEGKVIQVDEAKVRYKTANLPEKTLRVRQANAKGEIPKTAWMTLYRGKAGTGVFGETIPPAGYVVITECEDDGYLTDFGNVNRVSAIERLTVKEVGTGSVLGTKTRSLPVAFSPRRKHDTSGHITCSPGQPGGQ
jgi:hypothetical protein